MVVNWGNTKPIVFDCPVLNNVDAVRNAVNKLKCFEILKNNDVNIPEYVTTYEEAEELVLDGKTILARTVLNGHSGHGIVIVDDVDGLVDAPLYTVYKKKRNEYRVHVFLDEVIDVVEKRRVAGVEKTDEQSKIRSHRHGWVFCRENVSLTPALELIAKQAVKALGLDFGAVDIIYNAKEDKYYVLEVNTAPALTGTTLERYVEAFNSLLK